MGLFGKKEKYEKGGIIRGSLQCIKGGIEHSAGTAKRIAGDTSRGKYLQYRGAKDVDKGLKKILGFRVKKE